MNERFKLAGFTAVGMLILASVMTGLSASLLEISSDFGIPPSRAGILYTLHFGGFLGLLLFSLLLHGLRARLRLVTVAAAIYAVALATAGLSPGFSLLAIALFLAGGSGGLIEGHTATLQVMTSRNEAEAGSLVSVTQSFFALGALVTPVYLALEESLAADWRKLFLGLSLLGLIALAMGLRIKAQRFAFIHGETGSFIWRPLIRVSVAMALYVGAEVTIFGWAPTVMELYHDIPLSRARLAPTLFWIGMLGGRMLTAKLTSRISATTLLRASSLLGVLATVLLVTLEGEWLLWIALVLASIACAGIWPLIVATSGASGHETGTTITVAAGGLGATIFPYLAGISSEILPGRFIVVMAAPLLIGVFLLTRQSAPAAGSGA
jgi:FHS family glucose/mannose:H+ symporter-like MFS transporter